jgi:hypothetical protein
MRPQSSAKTQADTTVLSPSADRVAQLTEFWSDQPSHPFHRDHRSGLWTVPHGRPGPWRNTPSLGIPAAPPALDRLWHHGDWNACLRARDRTRSHHRCTRHGDRPIGGGRGGVGGRSHLRHRGFDPAPARGCRHVGRSGWNWAGLSRVSGRGGAMAKEHGWLAGKPHDARPDQSWSGRRRSDVAPVDRYPGAGT